MLTVLVRMTAATRPVQALGSALIEDVVWAAAEPQDRLEHLTVSDEENLVSIMAFVLAANKEQAVAQTSALLNRAVHQAGALRGWRVVECSAVDL